MGRKPKAKTQNQLAELSEENRRLREIVAYLSEVVLTRIAETTEPAGRVVRNPIKGPSSGSATNLEKSSGGKH
jgi:hypothetical protein